MVIRGPATSIRAGDQEIDPLSGQAPGQPAQPGPVHLRAGQHRHGIHVADPDGVVDTVKAAIDPNTDRGQLLRLAAAGNAGPDHPHAVVRVVPHLPDQFGDGAAVSYQQDVAHQVAPPPPTMNDPAGKVAGQQREGRGHRQGDDHIAAGDLRVGGPGSRRHDRDHGESGGENPPELLDAHRQEPGLVGPGDTHRRQPQGGQPCAEPQVFLQVILRQRITEPDEVGGRPCGERDRGVSPDEGAHIGPLPPAAGGP
jgi:hypothetical protein